MESMEEMEEMEEMEMALGSWKSNMDAASKVMSFARGGLGKPDMRIQVVTTISVQWTDEEGDVVFGDQFGVKEFHVHSAMLKIYSAFFREALDGASAGQTTETATSEATAGAQPQSQTQPQIPRARFKHEWVSKIKDDGSGEWMLAAGDGAQLVVATTPGPSLEQRDRVSRHFTLVACLLCAIYGRSLPLADPWAERIVPSLTRFGEQYGSLPAVSQSLCREVCYKTWYGVHPDRESASILSLFDSAILLRNPFLFRHLLMAVINPWTNPVIEHVQDGVKRLDTCDAKVQELVSKIRLVTDFKLGCVREQIENLKRHPEFCSFLSDVTADATAWYQRQPGCYTQDLPMPLPVLYRRMYDRLEQGISPLPGLNTSALTKSLDAVLINALPLSPADSAVVGTGYLMHSFVCEYIPDHLLPWDLDEIEW